MEGSKLWSFKKLQHSISSVSKLRQKAAWSLFTAALVYNGSASVKRAGNNLTQLWKTKTEKYEVRRTGGLTTSAHKFTENACAVLLISKWYHSTDHEDAAVV